MISRRVVAIIIIIAIVVAGAYLIISAGAYGSGNSIKVVGTGSSVVENTKTIEISSNGFSISALSISKGDTITFVNIDKNAKHWPASDWHPSHSLYPGSGIEKCQTEEKNLVFDSCKGLSYNEEWSFTFNEAGSWAFHDHFYPEFKGIITVE